MSVNRVVLVGRLCSEPEARQTTGGKSVTDFRIAVDKRIKPKDGESSADFFRVNCWGQTAEYVASYLTKGRLVAVDGRLQSRKYTASDGQNREVIEVVADNVQGLDRPREDASAAEPPTATAGVEYDPFEDQ